jgi:hypothetical protein
VVVVVVVVVPVTPKKTPPPSPTKPVTRELIFRPSRVCEGIDMALLSSF